MTFLSGDRLYATQEDDDDRPLPFNRLYATSDEESQAVKPVPPAKVEKQQVSRFEFDTRGIISTLLELLGIGALAVGGFLVAPWLGSMLLGALLVLLGVAVGYGD
jgi:hypothetical protein